MPAPYRLLLFDFDGTLVDTVGDIAHYVNEVLRERGYPEAPVARVQGAVGWGVHELLRNIEPRFLAHPADLEKAVETFKERYTRHPVLQTRPFPKVMETLKGPLQNIRKAIVTNKPQDIALRVLEELQMAPLFDAVIGMHAGFAPKPDPASMKHMMELFGEVPETTVYIGDSSVDADASVNAGVDFAWMEYGYQSPDGFNPRYRFSGAGEWAGLV